MTLSQIRNQVNSLERKFAKELAVFRLRRIAEEIANDWEISMAEKEQLPQPHQVVRRVARQGHLLKTWMNLSRYVQRCLDEKRCLIPQQIVLSLLPWAGNYRYHDILHGDTPSRPDEEGTSQFNLNGGLGPIGI